MRVLLLAFHYPPIGGSGPARTAALARMLKERGWEPVVLTVAHWPTAVRDPSIPHEPAAIRIGAPDPAILLAPLRLAGLHRLAAWIERRFVFPDRAILWAAAALPAAIRAARSCDVILSSSPPESAHLLAAAVARIAHRPWIADLRTEWSEYPGRTFRRLHRALERALLPRAARVVTLNDEHTARVREIGARADTLVAGWDPSEAQPPELAAPRRPAVVAYAGVFSDARTIDPFLDAAERLPAGTLELRVFGSPWSARDRIARTTVPVHLAGRLPRSAILDALRRADWLLVTLDARATRWIPNKVYEYAAVGRPILAFVPGDGATARWIRETGAGFVLPSDRPEEAARGLEEVLERWHAGRLQWRPDGARLERDSLPRVGERLDLILREAAPPRPERARSVRVALFFTLGASFDAWRRAGMLDRELDLYRRLAARGFSFRFLSYEPLPLLGRLPYPAFLHSLLLPFLRASTVRRAAVLKTNQMAGSWSAVLAKLAFGKPLYVRTGYTLSLMEHVRREPRRLAWARRAERLAYAFADAWSVTTPAQLAYVRRTHRPRVPGVVLPTGVDTDHFRPLDRPRRPGSVVAVGRLAPQKNLRALIEAMAGLPGELTIVGDGEHRDALARDAEERGVRVRFAGVVPNERLPEILNEHEVFVLPSLYEGLPKAMIEAMACGLAVVGTEIDGVREILADGPCGLVCAPTAAGIREALRAALADAGLRRRLGEAARRTAVERFSLARVMEQEALLYEEVRR